MLSRRVSRRFFGALVSSPAQSEICLARRSATCSSCCQEGCWTPADAQDSAALGACAHHAARGVSTAGSHTCIPAAWRQSCCSTALILLNESPVQLTALSTGTDVCKLLTMSLDFTVCELTCKAACRQHGFTVCKYATASLRLTARIKLRLDVRVSGAALLCCSSWVVAAYVTWGMVRQLLRQLAPPCSSVSRQCNAFVKLGQVSAHELQPCCMF